MVQSLGCIIADSGPRTYPGYGQLYTHAILVLLLALVGLVVATGVIVSAYSRHRDDPTRPFRLVVLLNIFTVIVAGGLREALIRIVSTPLLPYDWNAVGQRYRDSI